MSIKRFYRSFLYSASCRSGEEEANCFIATHEIISCERQVVVIDSDVKILLLIEYSGDTSEFSPNAKKKFEQRNRSRDEEEITLTDAEERIFRLLCDRRFAISKEKGAPPYDGGTNIHLKQIVRLRCASKADLKRIKGFGDAKINEYGDRYLEIMNAEIPSLTEEVSLGASQGDEVPFYVAPSEANE